MIVARGGRPDNVTNKKVTSGPFSMKYTLILTTSLMIFIIIAADAAISSKAIDIYLTKYMSHELSYYIKLFALTAFLCICIMLILLYIMLRRKHVSKAGHMIFNLVLIAIGIILMMCFKQMNSSVVRATDPWRIAIAVNDVVPFDILTDNGYNCIEERSGSGKRDILILPNPDRDVNVVIEYIRTYNTSK